MISAVKNVFHVKSEAQCLLLAFLIPLVVRAIPEALMGSYIVGFDPLAYYVPFVYSWIRHGVDFWGFLAEVPLFYCILTLATLFGIDIVFALKFLAPLLHGFLALAVYGYASRALGWSPRKSFFASLLATCYFVALRVSWDFLRNELALIFLFVALTLLQKGRNDWKSFVFLPLTMVLVTLSHELVTVIMLVIVTAVVLRLLFERDYVKARNLILMSLPAALLFLSTFYARCRVSPGEFTVLISFPGKEPEGWLSLFGFSSYPDMVVDMVGFLLYCYLLLLPLAAKGAKVLRNFQMKSWTLWSLGAVLFPVITQSARVNGFRWVLMLTYPLSFCAMEALTSIKLDYRRLLLLSTIGMFTVGFMTMPYEYGFPYFAIPRYQNYIPSSMLQNTVPVSDCQDTANVLRWLKNHMDEGARLLTHTAFYGWATLTLEESQIAYYEFGNPDEIAKDLADLGYDEVYLVWWVNGFGWHGQPTVSSSFKEIRRSGRVAIYIYEETL